MNRLVPLLVVAFLAAPALADPPKRLTPMEQLQAEVAELKRAVAELKAEVARLKKQIGEAPAVAEEPAEPAVETVEVGMTKAQAKAVLERLNLAYKAGPATRMETGRLETWYVEEGQPGQPKEIAFLNGKVTTVYEF